LSVPHRSRWLAGDSAYPTPRLSLCGPSPPRRFYACLSLPQCISRSSRAPLSRGGDRLSLLADDVQCPKWSVRRPQPQGITAHPGNRPSRWKPEDLGHPRPGDDYLAAANLPSGRRIRDPIVSAPPPMGRGKRSMRHSNAGFSGRGPGAENLDQFRRSIRGLGLSNTFGVAGYPSRKKAFKLGKGWTLMFLSSAGFLRQTIDLGGETEKLEPDPQSASAATQTANRLVFTIGKIFHRRRLRHQQICT